ncbi:MAG TPA: hypothetical protein VJR06_05940, partial [Nitrososphaerales archaeon]|nr:hypothetical protein [Nitrososphaerales archaeon]
YGGRAFNSLGSNELGIAGADCARQTGLHLNEDWFIFEVLKDGERVQAGERGELVATVLSNRTMPLIRYATGNTVELSDGDVCPCGSSMTRVKKVLGRKEDWIRGADGALYPPLRVAEDLEAALGIEDYQLVQSRIDAFEVKTANPDRDEKEFSVPLEEYLSDMVGVPVALKFSMRPQEDTWLKSRPVVCSIPQLSAWS